MAEQMSLMLHYNGEIDVVEKLRRSQTPITSQVQLDEATKKINDCFDFDFDGVNKFYPFEQSEFIKNLDFSILAIVGASGSGKSTFSKFFTGGVALRDLNGTTTNVY